MNMDEYFVLFREYMLVQKPSSVNTRDSYLRDVSAFLRYLEGENITSPLEVETETVEAYVQHLHSLNRTNSTISRNIASVRCFYKFLIPVSYTHLDVYKRQRYLNVSACAVSRSPATEAVASSCISFGMMLENVEMTPLPPRDAIGKVCVSSPE